VRVTTRGRRFKVDERRAIAASKLSNWTPNTDDTEGEHSCHLHPLGSVLVKRYWCGHTCMDEGVCRKYMFVWLLTHPLQVARHLRRLDYQGRSR
jgi:hypothetical protein